MKEIISRILPTLLYFLNGHFRYKPEITWEKSNWTHNIFRFYEMLFWRRYGIKPEMGSQAWKDEDGITHVVYQAHSWEAKSALLEMFVRDYISSVYRKIKRIRFNLDIFTDLANSLQPQYAFEGISYQNPQSKLHTGYSLAIAFDAGSTGYGTGTSLSFSHTCTGSNRYIAAGVSTIGVGLDLVTGATYNSVATTQLKKQADTTASPNCYVYLWGLASPASGSNTLAFAASSSTTMWSANASYSGATSTTSPVDGNNSGQIGATSPITLAITPTASNCWMVMFGGTQRAMTAGTGSTKRAGDAVNTNVIICDSNAALTAGVSNSMSLTNASGSGSSAAVAVTIAPFSAASAYVPKVLGCA